MTAQHLAGGKEPLNKTVTSRISLNVIRVDVERECNDSIAVSG